MWTPTSGVGVVWDGASVQAPQNSKLFTTLTALQKRVRVLILAVLATGEN